MNRVEFMKELEYLLQDILIEDKADALEYYRDYLEEAGDENEEQAMREFGSPERVAAIVRADLNGHLEDGGGFTESGYQDERFHDPRYRIVKHQELPEVTEEKTRSKENANDQRRKPQQDNQNLVGTILKIGLGVLLFCILAPVMLSVGGGALGLIVTVVCVIIAAALLIGALTLATGIAAVTVFVLGIGLLFTNPWSGLLLLGVAVLLLGAALIGVALSILMYVQFLPFCIRSTVDVLSRLIHRDWRMKK